MSPVQTVEDAIKTGEAFVGRYYGFKRPLKAKKEGDTWFVVFDVGILKVERVELRIDSDSGSIIEYKAPENP